MKTGLKAFTLVEMTVAVAVLAVLILMVSQLVGMASSTIGSDRKRIEADTEARLIFDRLATDLQKMPKRRDVDYIFYKQAGGNDKIFFYSEAPASSSSLGTTTAAPNTAALIGYRVNDNPGNPWEPVSSLERLGRQLNWDNSTTQMTYLMMTPSGPIPETTLAGAWPAVIGSSAAGYSDGADLTNYHTLGELTFRFKFCFQLIDGIYSDIPITIPAGVTNNPPQSGPHAATDGGTKAPGPTDDVNEGYSTGSRWFDKNSSRGYICLNSQANAAVWNPIGLDDVSAVVVAIATLDKDSRKTVAAKLPAIATALAAHDPVPTDYAANHLMDNLWQTELVSGAFPGEVQGGGIPPAVAGQVRVYQRFFYLGNNKTQ